MQPALLHHPERRHVIGRIAVDVVEKHALDRRTAVQLHAHAERAQTVEVLRFELVDVRERPVQALDRRRLVDGLNRREEGLNRAAQLCMHIERHVFVRHRLRDALPLRHGFGRRLGLFDQRAVVQRKVDGFAVTEVVEPVVALKRFHALDGVQHTVDVFRRLRLQPQVIVDAHRQRLLLRQCFDRFEVLHAEAAAAHVDVRRHAHAVELSIHGLRVLDHFRHRHFAELGHRHAHRAARSEEHTSELQSH